MNVAPIGINLNKSNNKGQSQNNSSIPIQGNSTDTFQKSKTNKAMSFTRKIPTDNANKLTNQLKEAAVEYLKTKYPLGRDKKIATIIKTFEPADLDNKGIINLLKPIVGGESRLDKDMHSSLINLIKMSKSKKALESLYYKKAEDSNKLELVDGIKTNLYSSVQNKFIDLVAEIGEPKHIDALMDIKNTTTPMVNPKSRARKVVEEKGSDEAKAKIREEEAEFAKWLKKDKKAEKKAKAKEAEAEANRSSSSSDDESPAPDPEPERYYTYP